MSPMCQAAQDVQSGDILYRTFLRHSLHFWAERIFEWFERPRLQIEVSQIIIHKTNQPDVVVDFLEELSRIHRDR